MILPYYVRLLCLCLTTFFVVHALVWLVVRSTASTAMRIAESMRPRMAARFLFAVRMTPVAVALFLILGFCVPSYVWLEPHIATEKVGWFCLLSAGLAAAAWGLSLLRGAVSVVVTNRYIRRCSSRAGAEPSSEVVVLQDAAAVMAVAGVMHPKLVVSQSVLDALSVEQKEAAFRHEAAHRASRDNLKRLLVLLSPDVTPLAGGLGSLERAWAMFTEWAADDEAVDGDQERALSLAAALVRVAKLGVHGRSSYLLASLMDDDRNLEIRVDRLLREPAYAEQPLKPVMAFLRSVGLTLAGISATLLLWPESLGSIHRLLEHLVQ